MIDNWFAMRIGVRTLFLADMPREPRHFLPQFGQLENVTFAAFNAGLLDTLVATASELSHPLVRHRLPTVQLLRAAAQGQLLE